MVASSVASSGVFCAGFPAALPVVPGVCVPAFVASGVPPAGVRVSWGVCLGGWGASWRPGLVLSGCDCDWLAVSAAQAVDDALVSWGASDSFCGPAPLVVSFWVLPSGAAVVASVAPVAAPGSVGALC